jgi:hypothetical protein
MQNTNTISIKNVFLILCLLSLVACGGGGGGGGGDDSTNTVSTTVDVFDGAATGCTVTVNDLTAIETSGSFGKYTIASALDTGAVVTATNCTDTDTASKLPVMYGVVQSDGVAISPITTLIVASAIDTLGGGVSYRTGARAISASTLANAISKVKTNLGLGDYDPVDPATANYVSAAKADTTGAGTAAVAMRVSLAISTLLKTIEVSAGSTDAATAVFAVAQSVVGSTVTIDLTDQAAITTVMEAAQIIQPSVATAIETATIAAAPLVVIIVNTPGDITIAIAATTSISEFLNTASESTIADTTVITDLVTTVTEVVVVATAAVTPACVLGTSTLNNCKT